MKTTGTANSAISQRIPTPVCKSTINLTVLVRMHTLGMSRFQAPLHQASAYSVQNDLSAGGAPDGTALEEKGEEEY